MNKNARYLSALPDGSALVRPQSARIDDDDAYSRAFMMTPLAAHSKQAAIYHTNKTRRSLRFIERACSCVACVRGVHPMIRNRRKI